MRLVNADALKICYTGSNGFDDKASYESIRKMIDIQPTAYDVDKVVENIRKIDDGYSVVADAYQRGASDGAKWMKKKAIEIVKGGGVFCQYETPCGWCVKFDSECMAKAGEKSEKKIDAEKEILAQVPALPE